MKHYLISLASILIVASFATAGCNNDGGLLGRLSSKDEPKAEQQEATQPNPDHVQNEPVAAQKEMTESEKIDALNKRIAETKALRKKYCPAIVNEAMYNHGSLMEMKFMYDYIETNHPELKGMSTNERSTKLKAIFRQMRITYYNSIDKKLGFFCGNIDKLCDGDSKPCHRIDDYLIDRGKSGRGTPRYELFDYYNKIPQYETLYELMEIVVLDWIDDDKDIFQSGKTNLDFLKEKFYININADPNQPVHVDWAQYGYKDNTPTVQEDNNKINLDNWILDPDKLGKAGDTYSKYLLLLVSSVKNQIELEQGKSTGQFFSIKKCLKPCLKSPSTCYQDMDDYYHESIYKLMRDSLALSSIAIPLSNGIANADDHLLSFTIGFASAMYLFASQPQTLNNFINTDAITASPVGREIYNSPLDFKSKQRLIGIWMLRQVHYAVEDIYNQMGVAKATGISFNEMIQGYDEFATPAFLDTITYDSKPTYIDWSKYSSKQKNTEHSLNIGGSYQMQLHGDISSTDAQQIGALLSEWNNAMNRHDADTVANTHTYQAMIRGTEYSVAEYRVKVAKAFSKHPDFQQSPANEVYATPLADKSGYAIIFDETFTQGGKSTPTEIMLVVIREGVNYKIIYESDISTDRNLLKKMGINATAWASPSDCMQLMGQILIESPVFRYEYIRQNKAFAKSKSLNIGCDEEECIVYDKGKPEQHYEFDFKSMKMTEIVFDYKTGIHPKYSSQISRLCQ